MEVTKKGKGNHYGEFLKIDCSLVSHVSESVQTAAEVIMSGQFTTKAPLTSRKFYESLMTCTLAVSEGMERKCLTVILHSLLRTHRYYQKYLRI